MQLTAAYTTVRVSQGQNPIYAPSSTATILPPEGFRQILLQNGVDETEIFRLWEQGLQMTMQAGQAPSTMTQEQMNDIASLILQRYQQQNPQIKLPMIATRRFASGLRRAARGAVTPEEWRKSLEIPYGVMEVLRSNGVDDEEIHRLWGEALQRGTAEGQDPSDPANLQEIVKDVLSPYQNQLIQNRLMRGR